MSDSFDLERMCRLNGQRPTLRDRWTAFYRLWRMCSGQGMWQEYGAGDCLRILANPRWVALVNEEVKTSRSHIPVFLRRRLLDGDRRMRLYGKHPEWVERDQLVAAKLREESGIEVTPEQVGETRQKIIRMAREKGRAMGITLPADDNELLLLLKKE